MLLTLTPEVLIMSIYANGAEVRRGTRALGNASGATSAVCTGLLRLGRGDYVEGGVTHTGPNPTNTTTTVGANMFQIILVGL